MCDRLIDQPITATVDRPVTVLQPNILCYINICRHFNPSNNNDKLNSLQYFYNFNGLKIKKKSPANSEIALFEQYVHDLDAVHDRHVSLASRLTKILRIC